MNIPYLQGIQGLEAENSWKYNGQVSFIRTLSRILT